MKIVWKDVYSEPYEIFGGAFVSNHIAGEFFKRESCSLTREIILAKGDKVKIRARIVYGSLAESAPNTFRFGIRKVPKAVP